jgi:dTDP-4-dehydrorhamnose 3,5-epimerase
MNVEGALLIEPELLADERGFFARTWCHEAFEARGLPADWVQSSISFNHRQGTLRGMHYQQAPFEETKLVRCTRGAIYDVLLDLRPSSPTFGRWQALELTMENHRQVYIPPGVAHGFMTLSDHSEVEYQISQLYRAEAARGVRWDDAAFGISWPQPVEVISARDASYAPWCELLAFPNGGLQLERATGEV